MILAALFIGVGVNAQSTNGIFGDIGNILGDVGISSNPTNYAAAAFYGHSTSGNQSSIGLLVIENVNNYVGVAAGVDDLFGGGKIGSANIVSGGLSLKAPTHPLAFLGTNSFEQNFTATPYALAMAALPINGTGQNGALGAVNRAGVNFDIYNLKGWEIGAGIDYGNRLGAGNYSGNWIDVAVSFRKNF